jgi:hypothetical protein
VRPFGEFSSLSNLIAPTEPLKVVAYKRTSKPDNNELALPHQNPAYGSWGNCSVHGVRGISVGDIIVIPFRERILVRRFELLLRR